MRSLRKALTTSAAVLGMGATALIGAPAQAAPALAGVSSAPAAASGCYTRLYFNNNTYLHLRATHNSTVMGLAYRGDTFHYDGNAANGFLHGRDGRAGGATGWVPAANISAMRIC